MEDWLAAITAAVEFPDADTCTISNPISLYLAWDKASTDAVWRALGVDSTLGVTLAKEWKHYVESGELFLCFACCSLCTVQLTSSPLRLSRESS